MSRLVLARRGQLKPIQRTFTFTPGTHIPVKLSVTLEHVPLVVKKEQAKKTEKRIIDRSRRSYLQDADDLALFQERIMQVFTASAVKKITAGEGEDGKPLPVTYGHLKCLVDLDPQGIAEAGGLDAPLWFDTADTTPLTDEDRKANAITNDPAAKSEREELGLVADFKSRGDVAFENVFMLVAGSGAFAQWVDAITSDVSWFQDADYDAQVGNSSAGAIKPAA